MEEVADLTDMRERRQRDAAEPARVWRGDRVRQHGAGAVVDPDCLSQVPERIGAHLHEVVGDGDVFGLEVFDRRGAITVGLPDGVVVYLRAVRVQHFDGNISEAAGIPGVVEDDVVPNDAAGVAGNAQAEADAAVAVADEVFLDQRSLRSRLPMYRLHRGVMLTDD